MAAERTPADRARRKTRLITAGIVLFTVACFAGALAAFNSHWQNGYIRHFLSNHLNSLGASDPASLEFDPSSGVYHYEWFGWIFHFSLVEPDRIQLLGKPGLGLGPHPWGARRIRLEARDFETLSTLAALAEHAGGPIRIPVGSAVILREADPGMEPEELLEEVLKGIDPERLPPRYRRGTDGG